MNQPCKYTPTICAFATKVCDVTFCGLTTGENRVEFMKKCPKKKAGRSDRTKKQ